MNIVDEVEAVIKLKSMVRGMIKERRQSGTKKGDLLSLLLEAEEDGQAFKLKDEAEDEAMKR